MKRGYLNKVGYYYSLTEKAIENHKRFVNYYNKLCNSPFKWQ